jgi:hypothetical protein
MMLIETGYNRGQPSRNEPYSVNAIARTKTHAAPHAIKYHFITSFVG